MRLRSRVFAVVVAASAVLVGTVPAAAVASPPANSALPTVNDTTPHDGDHLTAYPGSWSGSTPIAYAYQWLHCDGSGANCTPTSAATTSTYDVTSNDVGSTLAVRVTATNAYGAAVATSLVTAVVGAAAPVNTAVPAIAGTAAYGSTLTASAGTWSGTAPIAFSYKWKRCDSAGANCSYITNATSSTYIVAMTDATSTLRVAVTASNPGGTSSATSAPTAVVPAVLPSNTTRPTVNDTTPHDGDLLTGYSGSWSGTAPITLTVQWLRCDGSGLNCGPIAGASGSTYSVTSVDVGSTLSYRVTASNAAGSTSASSAVTSVVGAAAPADVSPPTVSGSPAYGITLTALPGTWTGTAPIAFSYKWKRCDSTGANCSYITNATSSTYTVGLGDAGDTLRVAVNASNAGGTAGASSAPTGVVGSVAPANVALPTIGDTTPHDMDVLTGSVGSWTGTAPIDESVQWLRCDSTGGACTPIAGATTTSYAVTPADVGGTLVLQVTASNAAGSAVAFSLATSPVAATAPVNTAAPTLTGTAVVGSTLSASTGTWTGTPTIAYAYRWMRCDAGGNTCDSITGATASTYTVVPDDANATLRVSVTASNGGGSSSVVSAATAPVPPVPPTNVAPPTINDTTPHDLDVLTGYPGSWSGTAPITYAYQWLRCDASVANCTAVAGASGTTYAVTSADIGSTLVFQVSASNAAASVVAPSAATSVVGAAPPVAGSPPSVTGVAQDGQALAATTGSWTGTAPITLTYRWLRCDTSGANCSTITGATSTSYRLTSADVGSTIRFAVNASNVAGIASSTSAATAIVLAVVPRSNASPVLTGLAEQGLALSTSNGTWSGTLPMTFLYQWSRCDSTGASCAAISGATAANYTAAAADAGATLRASVTATNSGGSTVATSAPSSVVAPAGAVLFADAFNRADGLVTNQYAYFNPTHPDAVISPDWAMTNGSLFVHDDTGWTGVPDSVAPDGLSDNGTGSAIFRLHTKRFDFGDVAVSLALLNNGLTSTAQTPATDWDGVHVWLRYLDETHLYAISVNRRDSTIRFKKKCPGGPTNGGVYYDLVGKSPTVPVPYGTWQQVQVTIRSNADGSVTLELYLGGALIQRVVDTGVGCAPITAAGAAGIRGDNDNFQFDDFTVRAL